MNVENISSACLLMWDALQEDKQSKSLLSKMDKAKNDTQIIDGLKKGVGRLRELGKDNIANEIEKKTKGFAF